MMIPRFRASAVFWLVLPLLILEGLTVVRAQPEHSPPSRPVALQVPIIFTRTTVDPGAASDHSGQATMEGARLILLTPDGRGTNLTEGFSSACDPDVSPDGTRILFAGKRQADEEWNVYEMDLKAREARQITRSAGNCRHPIYTSSFYTITEKEPWDQIAFVSTLAGTADERTGAPATSLYTCKLDGSFLQRISYNLSSDLDPAVLEDGRLVYAAWRRATFDNGVPGRLTLETMNTDGSDRAPLVGTQSARPLRMPCATTDGWVVFVESRTDANQGLGTLAAVALRRPLHTYRAITKEQDGFYVSPAPLPDGRILASWRAAKASGALGIYRLATDSGTRKLVHEDPGHHAFQARAVFPRRKPDGRSSAIALNDSLAEFYCLNIYTNDLGNASWLPKGSVRTLRVLEGMPLKSESRSAEPSITRDLAPRRILAEAPVEQDGSFHLSVPANTSIQLQILDDQGLALRSCGWIWARNHQAQGCIGCHEDPELTPTNRVPDALRGEAFKTAVPEAQRIAVDFARDLAPILATRCAGCHDAKGSVPDLRQDGAPSDVRLRRIYEALIGREQASEGTGMGRYVHPGRARTSPLLWHVLGRNTSRPWDGASAAAPARPIPQNGQSALSKDETQTIIRWIDLGARFAGQPEVRAAAVTGQNR